MQGGIQGGPWHGSHERKITNHRSQAFYLFYIFRVFGNWRHHKSREIRSSTYTVTNNVRFFGFFYMSRLIHAARIMKNNLLKLHYMVNKNSQARVMRKPLYGPLCTLLTSEAISSKPLTCRSFSAFIRLYISGSSASRESVPVHTALCRMLALYTKLSGTFQKG